MFATVLFLEILSSSSVDIHVYMYHKDKQANCDKRHCDIVIKVIETREEKVQCCAMSMAINHLSNDISYLINWKCY